MCVFFCVFLFYYFVVWNFLCSLFFGITFFSLTSPKGDVYFRGPRLEDEIAALETEIFGFYVEFFGV